MPLHRRPWTLVLPAFVVTGDHPVPLFLEAPALRNLARPGIKALLSL